MDSNDVGRFANAVEGFMEAIAFEAELESMKTENEKRKSEGLAMAYHEDDFARLSNSIIERKIQRFNY